MNRTTIHVSIGMAGGLGLGFVGGYLVARRAMGKTVDERVAREIETVKAHYRARANMASKGHHPGQRAATMGTTGPGREHDLPTGVDSAGEQLSDAERVLPEDDDNSGERPAAVGTAYRGDPLEGMPGHDPGSEEDHGDDAGPSPDVDRIRPRPFVISFGEFEGEKYDYRKISVTWYAGDGVLADDQDQPVRDFESVIGSDFQIEFGKDTGNQGPDMVFVRNDRLQSDFEITRDERSYTEVVLNYGRPQ
jgi:hypothetical protein